MPFLESHKRTEPSCEQLATKSLLADQSQPEIIGYRFVNPTILEFWR